MEKPFCRLCLHRHLSHEPHVFINNPIRTAFVDTLEGMTPVELTPAEEGVMRSALTRSCEETTDETKECPQCGGTGRVASSRAAYMRAYRKRKSG